MTQEEYHNNEMSRFCRRIGGIERAPLRERQEAREEWKEALAYPESIARHISWILDGHYGYGEMQHATAIVSGGGDKNARLCILLAALDHNCPANFARAAFMRIPADKRIEIDAAIQRVIDDYLREKKEEEELCQTLS